MDFSEKRKLIKVFFMSQFSYYQLVWMRHNRTMHNQNNKNLLKATQLTLYFSKGKS